MSLALEGDGMDVPLFGAIQTTIPRSASVPDLSATGWGGASPSRRSPTIEVHHDGGILAPGVAGMVPELSASVSVSALDDLRGPKSPGPDVPSRERLMMEIQDQAEQDDTVTGYFAKEMLQSPSVIQDESGVDSAIKKDANIALSAAAQWNQLEFYHLTADGACRRRVLSRVEILAEANKDFEMLLPGPKKIGNWLVSLEAGQELKEFRKRMGIAEGRKDRGVLKKLLKTALQLRDIRQVDPAFSAKPALWVRHSAYVISLEGIRTIITCDGAYVFDPDGEKTVRALPILRQRLHSEENAEDVFMPFEFRALEGVLIVVVMRLEQDFVRLEPSISSSLRELPKLLTSSLLEELRTNQVKLNHYRSRLETVQAEITELLEDDEEMSMMYLTEKRRTPDIVRNPIDHDEVETLLESYLQVIDDLGARAKLLDVAIEDTEDLVGIHLDTLRNRLLMVQLTLSIVGVALTFGALIAGLFGMNLEIPLYTDPHSAWWFFGIVTFICISVICISFSVLRYLRYLGLYTGI